MTLEFPLFLASPVGSSGPAPPRQSTGSSLGFPDSDDALALRGPQSSLSHALVQGLVGLSCGFLFCEVAVVQAGNSGQEFQKRGLLHPGDRKGLQEMVAAGGSGRGELPLKAKPACWAEAPLAAPQGGSWQEQLETGRLCRPRCRESKALTPAPRYPGTI